LCMVLLISTGTIKADHKRSSNEGHHPKATDPEFRDLDYDDDQVGDYKDEIYSYEEQQITTRHSEADVYSHDPEFHDAEYDDVVSLQINYWSLPNKDFAMIITTGTFAFLALIAIGLMAYRYSQCNKSMKFDKADSNDAKELKILATKGYNKVKLEDTSVVESEEDLMLKL